MDTRNATSTPSRRDFLLTTGSVAGTLFIGLSGPRAEAGRVGPPPRRLAAVPTAGCRAVEGPAVIPGARWYEVDRASEGLDYRFEPGALADAETLTADFLVEGNTLVVFQLRLQEGDAGRVFTLDYAAVHDAEARLRMRTDAVTQNRWQFPREGAWLKPMAGGAVVNLENVDRMAIRVLRKSDHPARWCQTEVTATAASVDRLAAPRLPKGALIDELG